MKHLLIMMLLLSSLLYAEEIVMYPSDDMYTDAEHPGTPPSTTELWTGNYSPAGHFERTMIKFDLSQLEGYEVESANLRLTRFFSCPSGGTTATIIYPLTQDWNETTWPSTQHVSYDATIGYPYVFSGPGNTVDYEFNVNITELVQLWAAEVIDNHGLLIKANANNKFSKFYSKEYSNTSFRPELTVNANPVSNEEETISTVISYIGNYPNPFNPSTSIELNLKEKSEVSISIFDIKGRRINTLVNDVLSSGRHLFKWNGIDSNGKALPSGIYLYRVKTYNSVITKKMTLMK